MHIYGIRKLSIFCICSKFNNSINKKFYYFNFLNFSNLTKLLCLILNMEIKIKHNLATLNTNSCTLSCKDRTSINT